MTKLSFVRSFVRVRQQRPTHQTAGPTHHSIFTDVFIDLTEFISWSEFGCIIESLATPPARVCCFADQMPKSTTWLHRVSVCVPVQPYEQWTVKANRGWHLLMLMLLLLLLLFCFVGENIITESFATGAACLSVRRQVACAPRLSITCVPINNSRWKLFGSELQLSPSPPPPSPRLYSRHIDRLWLYRDRTAANGRRPSINRYESMRWMSIN